LDALELDVEVELQPGDIAVRQVRESRVPEGIVLLEHQHDREVALVAEDARYVEPGVRRAPQGSRRAIGVEALEVHGSVGLELVDWVHDDSRVAIRQEQACGRTIMEDWEVLLAFNR